ncbi:hypothetical protein D3C78_1597730 [compost metagenome]
MVQLAVALQGVQCHAGNHGRDDVHHLGRHEREINNGHGAVGGLVIADVVAQPVIQRQILGIA